MNLDNHIAKRFLTDDSLLMEMVEATHPDVHKFLDRQPIEPGIRNVAGYNVYMTEEMIFAALRELFDLLETPKNHKPYYCTETILACLDILKVNKKGPNYDWTYFNGLKNQIATFIFPGNKLLRMRIADDIIHFAHIEFNPKNPDGNNLNWVMFWLNRQTGEVCEHFKHIDVKRIEKFIYHLLCFVYLSEPETVEVPAHGRYGTRKSGKVVNTTSFPLTIINSKWNITSICTDNIEVGPHFRVYHTGPGRTKAVVRFIDQHVRHGYTRKAKAEIVK